MFSLIGHQLVLAMLDRAASEGRVRHAYLLAGPARVGKSTVARWMATRLNCIGPQPPCGACRQCTRIQAGIHPDVRALQLAGDRDTSLGLAVDLPSRSSRTVERVISIDHVRALQHDASLAPHEARTKVYLIVGAESLSLEAANCLLKTLEEPPENVVLLLTAVDPADLPSTVVSRCQVVRMGAVASPLIAAGLRDYSGCDSQQADLLARLSGGRPGWAIEAANDPALLTERAQALDNLTLTTGRSFRDRLDLSERLANEFSRDQRKVLRTLTLWQLYWWDVQLIQRGCSDLVTNVDRTDELDRIASETSSSTVHAYVRRVDLAAQRLTQNVNPRLALEALLLTTPVIG